MFPVSLQTYSAEDDFFVRMDRNKLRKIILTVIIHRGPSVGSMKLLQALVLVQRDVLGPLENRNGPQETAIKAG